jgi:hypothetical protein
LHHHDINKPLRQRDKGEHSSIIKGLFNDLSRTLLSSAIFFGDLHLYIENDSKIFEHWWMANEQLKRAIEFFLELRFTYFFNESSICPAENPPDVSPSDFQQMMQKMSKALNNMIGICRMGLSVGTEELSRENLQEFLGVAEEVFFFIQKTSK